MRQTRYLIKVDYNGDSALVHIVYNNKKRIL